MKMFSFCSFLSVRCCKLKKGDIFQVASKVSIMQRLDFRLLLLVIISVNLGANRGSSIYLSFYRLKDLAMYITYWFCI